MNKSSSTFPASSLYKSTAGRYRPVRVADGSVTARCRFMYNAYFGYTFCKALHPQYSLVKIILDKMVSFLRHFVSETKYWYFFFQNPFKVPKHAMKDKGKYKSHHSVSKLSVFRIKDRKKQMSRSQHFLQNCMYGQGRLWSACIVWSEFARQTTCSQYSKVSSGELRRLWSAYAHYNLSLGWEHMQSCRKCCTSTWPHWVDWVVKPQYKQKTSDQMA